MNSSLLSQLLEEYEIYSEEYKFFALREIFQEFTLAGLYRGNFFQHAAFYGGTCLRIFYGLPRFSEDLDFSLLKKDENFRLEPFFEKIIQEFKAIGVTVTIDSKQKKNPTQIESAFLKTDTKIYDIKIIDNQTIKIKIEVDILPPLNFSTEEKLLTKPLPFYVKVFSLPDLFAGKLHALLFRSWKKRVKGRDWYDLEWYIQRGITPNLNHFLTRAHENGDIPINQSKISISEMKERLNARIEILDIEQGKLDIQRFLRNKDHLQIWSKKYFKDLVSKLN